MAITQEVLKTGTRAVPGGNLLLPAMGVGAAAFAASGRGDKEYEKGFFRVVNEGEVGIRTHMGKPRYTKETAGLPPEERRARIAHPAGHPRIGFPFLRPLRIVNVQDRSLNLGEIIIDKADEDDNAQYRVDASVIWGITPELADRSVFRNTTLVLSVGEICQNRLRRAVQQTPVSDITSPDLTQHLLEIMHEECDAQLENYGSDLRGLNIGSYAKTEAQLHKESLAQLAGNSALTYAQPVGVVAAAGITSLD